MFRSIGVHSTVRTLGYGQVFQLTLSIRLKQSMCIAYESLVKESLVTVYT